MRSGLAIVGAVISGTLGNHVFAQASPPQPIGPWRTTVAPAPQKNASGLTTGALPTATAHAVDGIASFYWQDQMTASGELFDKTAMTAAHRTLPMNTKVRVTHVASGRQVIVRINDRGPFKPGRVIDLSQAAAEALQMTGAGLAQVKLEVIR